MQLPPALMMEVAPAVPGSAVPPADPGSNLPVYGQAAAPLPYSMNPAAAAAPYPLVCGQYQQQPAVNPGYQPPTAAAPPPYPMA